MPADTNRFPQVAVRRFTSFQCVASAQSLGASPVTMCSGGRASIEAASIDALPPEHIVTGDAPKLCAEATHWNDVKRRTATCGKRFVSAGIEHVCASRIEHQPRSLHVCICGARHLEA